MKRMWVLIALGLMILVAAVLLKQPALAPGGEVANTKSAALGGQKLFLEVARTESEREKGLSGRETLDPLRGMLFVFDAPGRPCFWMKDTLVPLDILWFDQDYKLVYMQQNVQPASYPENFCPDHDAQYVVELRAGTAAGFNLKIGDVLTLN